MLWGQYRKREVGEYLRGPSPGMFRFTLPQIVFAPCQFELPLHTLNACLKNRLGVAQATRLCRPATRRTERDQRFEAMIRPFPLVSSASGPT